MNTTRAKSTCPKLLIFFFVAVLIAVASAPLTAFADTGPKPSVEISFKNLSDEECWCTLLSETEESGPWRVWDGKTENISGDFSRASEEKLKIFYAFADYKDSDGFYFLQVGKTINDTKKFSWWYYPPSVFKILLYFPETETFVTSEICERYAFDSYFTVDMSVVNTDGKFDVSKASATLTPTRSYNYFAEILGLLARMAITLAIEMGIAWLFRFRGKRTWFTILFTNIGTQLLLNIVLNLAMYFQGRLMMILIYFLAEFFVLVIEAVVYSVVLQKSEPKVPVWKSILYAFVANMVSFLGGLALAIWVPILF